MCILFFYNNPNSCTKQYRLILAFNRDEHYYRSTEPVNYLNEERTLIGGRDLETVERGTWLGLSTLGKIAALLNVWCPEDVTDSTRGTLTMDFLRNKQITGYEYILNVFSSNRKYNGYNLLLFEIGLKNITVTYATNKEVCGNYQTKLLDGIHAFGNTVISQSLGKIKHGKERFAEIIAKYNSTEEKDQLLEQLLTFLKSSERYPHEVSEELSADRHFYRKNCNTIFVNMPDLNFGTRTHTVILLDAYGHVEFHEWNKEVDTTNWLHREFQERLNIEKI